MNFVSIIKKKIIDTDRKIEIPTEETITRRKNNNNNKNNNDDLHSGKCHTFMATDRVY